MLLGQNQEFHAVCSWQLKYRFDRWAPTWSNRKSRQSFDVSVALFCETAARVYVFRHLTSNSRLLANDVVDWLYRLRYQILKNRVECHSIFWRQCDIDVLVLGPSCSQRCTHCCLRCKSPVLRRNYCSIVTPNVIRTKYVRSEILCIEHSGRSQRFIMTTSWLKSLSNMHCMLTPE